MSVVAVIPARGQSKGIPGKNVARVGGVPLVARAVHAAVAAKRIDAVYVSTDDHLIGAAARAAGARVIKRPAELAEDQSSSESALLHACAELTLDQGLEPSILVFIQATSPFIDSHDLDAAIDRVQTRRYDSVFAAVETYEFLWKIDDDDAVGLNHDRAHRPRRQDREAHFRETGAFYVMDWEGFLRSGHRFFGRVGVQTVDEISAIEIDTPAELAASRQLASLFSSTYSDLSRIRGLVMDFDGVHTDDHVYVDQDGVESVRASRADGLGLSMLREAGMPMVIISKERNPVVLARANKLSIPVVQGIDNKAQAVLAWARDLDLDPADVAYIGNDVNDLPALELVGWPIAVADAHPEVRTAARIVLAHPGGSGALREFANVLLGTKRGENP